jgi:methionine synthase II (cobalamin-independent)
VAQGITERLKRYAETVPEDVELGFHLCYGDYKHEHLQEPDDCRTCVDIINAASAGIDRDIDWVHIPVPIERDDDSYYAPLDELDLPEGTELYLGLIHYRDGAEGAWRRIATAKRHSGSFGVATECGMGRRPPERGGAEDTLRDLLRIHTRVAGPVRES